MSDQKKGTESTVLGLPEVGNSSTQVIDTAVPTAPGLDQVTSPSLPPVVVETVVSPPRTRTAGGAMRAASDPPARTKTGGAIPRADAGPRRQSRVAQATAQEQIATGENPAHTPPPRFEWTMPRVAGLAGGVGLLFILAWVFWPSGAARHRVAPTVAPVEEPVAVAQPRPTPIAPITAPVAAAPTKPTLKLDAKTHVVDPYAAHLGDLTLDPGHKYRLRIERDDARLGTALARLDEKQGWGVMRKMASHAVLQFGGAKHLRLHCEPGTHFQDGQTLPLELLDLATKKKTPVQVNPALHCWDFEVARVLELGEGVTKRVRVPTDSQVVLGEKVSLRVAWILESLGEKKEWRTGVLGPGESVLAEGRLARFAILDPYAGDNEGTLELELLSGDTENSGLVTPSATGAQFVVPK